MRILKLAFLSFLFFFALLTAISLFIPSHIRISKAIDITGNQDSLVTLIANRLEWPRWHPLFQQPNIDSLLIQNHITIEPLLKSDSLVTVAWQQPGKRPVINGWQLYTSHTSNAVTLQWYMDFDLPWYPWQKFSSLFYEKTYGLMMDRGLKNLKALVQKQP